MRLLTLRLTAALLSASLLTSACVTNPAAGGRGAGGSDSGGLASASYVQSCLGGAVVAAGITALLNRNKGGSAKSDMLKAMAGGCVVGLAATAIAKVMDQQQQARHEEAMQREAKRLALEQQKFAEVQARHDAMPAATPKQRAVRDASLERARAEWQANYTKPVTVDLGEGGRSTVRPQVPTELPKVGQAPACFDQTVLVQTTRGTAKQVETWCPNASGVLVRAEARPEQA